jgi:hypothetical protein
VIFLGFKRIYAKRRDVESFGCDFLEGRDRRKSLEGEIALKAYTACRGTSGRWSAVGGAACVGSKMLRRL